ncbi:cation:dicarboxylase symporter family transporter [Gluconacetobacter azotocaptans]|uniref:cation:dicarboxylate symporter family transporter n=1 Tax=Gluconacetobacter azotocaptans TaxID=142834 RepID=UPI001956FC39|nr:cation:dicarboxylase symporter family transporter [Gluconacetobacter azotocaptans]MBM9402081.1 cation:dicarboxylase symporter family transporter [Gluconacetobacter azotocaptans]
MTSSAPAAPTLSARGSGHRLFVAVVAATVLGAVLGVAAPGWAAGLRVLGDAFLHLISMVVGPLVFCVVVQGIAGAESLRAVGRIGLKALLYFEGMTTLALLMGVGGAWLFTPGRHMGVRMDTLDASALAAYAGHADAMRQGGVAGFLLNLIPASPVAAFARNDVLEILFFSILFGACLLMSGDAGQPVRALVASVNAVLFRMMGVVTWFAPLGVLGAVAYTTARYGLGSLGQLMSFVLLYVLIVAAFVAVCLGGVLRACGVGLLPFLAYFREELIITSATTSSDAVMPQVMRKLTALGVRADVVGLVMPAGYSFNLDALSIYLGLATLFLAQATGTPLSPGQLALILGMALVTSKGAHGVPGFGIVVLAATLAVVPSIPPIGLVLVLSVDWFVGIARAVGNLVGNCVATVAVAAWEGQFDAGRARRVLGARQALPLEPRQRLAGQGGLCPNPAGPEALGSEHE